MKHKDFCEDFVSEGNFSCITSTCACIFILALKNQVDTLTHPDQVCSFPERKSLVTQFIERFTEQRLHGLCIWFANAELFRKTGALAARRC